MATVTERAFGKSPRTVALEEGYELLESDGGTYCYEHPTTGYGVLISVVTDPVSGKVTYDWSIHEPETGEVIAAQWGDSDAVHFLRQLIQNGLDFSFSPTYPTQPIIKGICSNCKKEKELDSNGFCWTC